MPSLAASARGSSRNCSSVSFLLVTEQCNIIIFTQVNSHDVAVEVFFPYGSEIEVASIIYRLKSFLGEVFYLLHLEVLQLGQKEEVCFFSVPLS